MPVYVLAYLLATVETLDSHNISPRVQDVLAIIVGALVMLVVVLAVFGIETNRRSLEDIAPSLDTNDALPASSLSHESQR